MADSRCCFGCSNVRKGAWVISIFDMLICIILTIRAISTLSITPYSYSFKMKQNSLYDDASPSSERLQQLEKDFNIFSQLFIIFLFFYVNLNLKKATFIRNAQSINQWLVINLIFFVFFALFIGFTTIKNASPDIIPIGIPVSIVVVYQIYVVKCFYDDELNAITPPTLHATPYVTITSQTLQTPVYPVQAGPYVIQQVHQPISQTPYPQQTYQYQPQQQTPSQSHVAMPVPSQQTLQEYCNPPPYSPSYNTQEGSSAKQ
uniref:Lysosomal-associated transmembrane protein 4A n=1 Tax=Schizaphis graminum TaxID=13262 RepID=A0A2S2PEY0_SCHGA